MANGLASRRSVSLSPVSGLYSSGSGGDGEGDGEGEGDGTGEGDGDNDGEGDSSGPGDDFEQPEIMIIRQRHTAASLFIVTSQSWFGLGQYCFLRRSRGKQYLCHLCKLFYKGSTKNAIGFIEKPSYFI